MLAGGRFLTPPDAFGLVEDGVYRSSAPQAGHLDHLRGLGLKTVIYLSPELPNRAVSGFYAEHGIGLVQLGLKAWAPHNTWNPVSEELIKDALELVLDATTHPVLIVCTSGIHQTGTVVACLRRLQHWALTPALVEYRAFAGQKARLANEQFVELFDPDLVSVPPVTPEWWRNGEKIWSQEVDENVKRRSEREGGRGGGGRKVDDNHCSQVGVERAWKEAVFQLHPPLVSAAVGPISPESLVDDDD